MTDEQFRITCLQLASSMPGDEGVPTAQETLRAAKMFYEWVTKADVPSPSERFAA